MTNPLLMPDPIGEKRSSLSRFFTSTDHFRLGDTFYRKEAATQFYLFELNIERRKTEKFSLVAVVGRRTEDGRVFLILLTNLKSPGALLQQVKVDGFQMQPQRTDPEHYSVAEQIWVIDAHDRDYDVLLERTASGFVLALKKATFSDIPGEIQPV